MAQRYSVDIVAKVLGNRAVDKLEKELGGADKNAKRLNKTLGKTSAILAKLGAGLVGLDLGRRFFKGFQEADKARAAVKTLGVDVRALEAELQRVSASSGGLASTTELLAASYDVASAGFSNAADNAKILDASLKGAVGGLSDLNTVSDAATSVLNSYGLKASEVSRIVDGFIQTQNDGKIVVDQYARQIGRLAPIAATAGVGIEELNAAISTITAQGVPVEATFTGLRQAIAAILKPTSEASKLAKSLGIEFNAAALKSKGLGGVLQDVIIKTNGSDEALTQLFGSVEALAAILPLTNDGLEKYNKNLDNQVEKTGQAKNATDELGGTVSAQITKIVNNIGNLARALDTILGPALQRIAGQINNILQQLNLAIARFGDLQIGAAAQDLFKGKLAITFGFRSEGIDQIEKALGQLNPALISNQDQLNRFREIVTDIQLELAKIPATGTELDNKLVDLQKNALTLLSYATKLEQKGFGASATGTQPPVLPPTLPPTLPPDLSTKTAGLLPSEEQDRLRLQISKELRENQEAITEAILSGDKALVRKLKIEQQFIPIQAEIKALESDRNDLVKNREALIAQGFKAADVDKAIAERALRLEELRNDEIRKREKLRGDEAQDIIDAGGDIGKTLAGKDPKKKTEELTAAAKAVESAYQRVGQAIEDSLVAGIESAIDGTKRLDESLQEIASNLLKDLGRLFIRAGVSSIAGPGGLGLPGFAEGGIASAGSPALVGEKGPEIITPMSPTLVTPFADARDAISKDGGESADDAFNANAAALGAAAAITAEKAASEKQENYMNRESNMTIETQVINSVEYATIDQVQKASAAASKAAQAQMMSNMRNKPAYRAGVGV